MRSNAVWVFAVVAAAAGSGCGCSGKGGTTPPGGGDVAGLVAEADRELVVSRTLDYRAPREDVRRDAQARAVDLLAKACTLGSARSCWLAAELPDNHMLAQLHDQVSVLGQQCLKGRAMSCLALRGKQLRESGFGYEARAAETDALCAKGLAAACHGAAHRSIANPVARRDWLQKGCDLGDSRSCADAAELDKDAGKPADEVAALELKASERAAFECDQGWAASCLYLAQAHGGDMARVAKAAQNGCEAGLMEDCDLLTRNDIEAGARAYGMTWQCVLQGVGCNILASTLTDPLAARDAWEHGCQLGSREECLALVKRYRVEDFPEPVPGRGRDLADYLCKTRDLPEACEFATK